jgi:hypothetical protein
MCTSTDDVPRRIDQVQDVGFTSSRIAVEHRRCLCFHCDTALTLDGQVVEHLGVFFRQCADVSRRLEQSIRQCALAVVDVCDDGEVSDVMRRPAIDQRPLLGLREETALRQRGADCATRGGSGV